MARLMSDARVFTPSLSVQSFLSARSICPISTGIPVAETSAFIFRSEPSPGAAIASEQLIRFLRAPRAGRIIEQLRRALLLGPRILDRIDKRPRFLNFVPARKQSRIAAHRIEEEPLVSFRARFADRC